MAKLTDLTTRELEFLELVIAGKTNQAITREICISEKTVAFHLDLSYTKTGVRPRLLTSIRALQ